MIIVDTSVWISHLRCGDTALKKILLNAEAVLHPFVLGELACGNFSNRKSILSLLNSLPSAPVAEQYEFFELIEREKLWGIGLGFVDIHLLASALISGHQIYTCDKSLRSAANTIGLAFSA